MDGAFQHALLAEEQVHVCLGVRLVPLTVGHLFLLLEHGNNYPDYVESATLGDLIDAVAICWLPHRKARKFVNGRFRFLHMWIWGKIIGRKPNEHDEAIFCQYLESHIRFPQLDTYKPGSEKSVPMCWKLLNMLMVDFHMSEATAMDTPVAKAVMMWAVEADRKGAMKLASDRQIKFREWVRAQEADRMAREAVNGNS